MDEQKDDIPQRIPNARDWGIMTIEGICFIGQVVVCILFYNWLGLGWLTYLGWVVLVVAMFAGWAARIAFHREGRAGTGRDWLRTTAVVDSGVYGLVRHPMYLSFMLISLGLVLLSQHWLNLAFGAVLMLLLYYDMIREERGNLMKFGDVYRHYMEHVPRMNALLGAIRLIRSKNG